MATKPSRITDTALPAIVNLSPRLEVSDSEHKLAAMFRDILTASIYDLAKETPLDTMLNLSACCGNQVLLKREDCQPIFTFKVRGAYNMIRQLSAAQREAGIVTASAGNHAQGVALASKHLNIAATIVMPVTTPDTKVLKVRSLGAKEILYGDTYDDAYAHAVQLAEKHRLSYIPAFDHPQVIAGQGTVAMEMLRQSDAPIDAVFIPVGGGGLLAGMTAYIKYLQPNIKVYAVEPEDSDCFAQAMEQGKRVELDRVGLFVDGVSVRQIGEHTYSLVKDYIDGCIRVSIDEICVAVKDIFDDGRVVAEPAGALALAGLKKYVQQTGQQGKRLAAINSGANTNFERLMHVVERAQTGEKHEIILAVTLNEQAGSFLKFCRLLKGYNITEFNYRYASTDKAHIFVGIRLKAGKSSRDIVGYLQSKGYEVEDMSNNDMAVTHVRHMVGGRKPDQVQIENELVYRCVFPERPGALLDFLISIRNAGNWNISLFHYRNHGAAYGRALLGVQVPLEQRETFDEFVARNSGMTFVPENDNPAYQFFLC